VSLRVQEVEEVSVLVRDLVSLPCALCSSGCHSIGICLIVLGLYVMPFTELVLVVDLGSGGHDLNTSGMFL